MCFAFVAKRRRKEKKNKEKHYDKKPLWPWMMDDGTGENATELARLQSVPMKRELSRSTSFLSKTIVSHCTDEKHVITVFPWSKTAHP